MKLGGTVEELMDRMSPIEFVHWRSMYRLEPFGYDIENYRMGTIASAVVNVTRTKKSQLTKPSDFYPVTKPAKNRKPKLTDRQRQQLEKKRGRSAGKV